MFSIWTSVENLVGKELKHEMSNALLKDRFIIKCNKYQFKTFPYLVCQTRGT